jgi:hypothetical protein
MTSASAAAMASRNLTTVAGGAGQVGCSAPHGRSPVVLVGGPRARGGGYPPQELAGCWAAWTVVTSRPATAAVARTVAEPAGTDDARVLNDW